jgi:peptidoglycan pentaglycine glycine transferase (the first glycine)
MNLQIKLCQEHEKSIWDEFVSGNENGHFMQSWAWGEFKINQGWIPYRFLILENESLCGAIQVLSYSFFGLGILLYAPCGPVLKTVDPNILRFMIKSIHNFFPYAITMRIDPYLRENHISANNFCLSFKQLDEEWSFWNNHKYTLWLDISNGADVVFRRMKASQRNQILSPRKKGVRIIPGGVQDVDKFHKLMLDMSNAKGIACRNKSYFQELFKVMFENGMADLVFAEFEGRKISCGLSVRYGNKSWLMYAATQRNVQPLNPSRFVQWEMINAAAEAGCKRYDFRGTATGRIPNQNDPNYGVYKFKKDFGPELVPLIGYYDCIINSKLYPLLRFTEKKALPLLHSGYKLFQKTVQMKS